LIGGAVFPAAFAITWKQQSKAGAISGALGGLAAGIIAWLVEAKVLYGELTVATTGMNYPTLAGNLAAVMTGLIISVVVSLIKPDDFDWEITRSMNPIPRTLTGTAPMNEKTSGMETPEDETKHSSDDVKSISTKPPAPIDPIILDEERQASFDANVEHHPSELNSAFKLACWASGILTFLMDFLIPIPMFLSHYVFSKGFFTGWVIISFMWVFSSAAISIILPIWETAGFFKELVGEIFRDVRGGRKKKAVVEEAEK